MTEAELREIAAWLAVANTPCGNDVCVGEWAQRHGAALVSEVLRLRAILKKLGIDPNGERA